MFNPQTIPKERAKKNPKQGYTRSKRRERIEFLRFISKMTIL